MAERLTNNAIDRLAGPITSSDTVITVQSATEFPPTGTFRIRIDNELLKVTGVSGNNFTVVRGSESTTAAVHQGGSLVVHILTAEALAALISEDLSLSTLAGDGITNDAPALQVLIDNLSAAGGGKIFMPDKYLIDSVLTVKDNVRLESFWTNPDESLPATAQDYNTRNGQLIINSATTINMNDSAAVTGFLVMRKGLTLPFASAIAAAAGVAAFNGTAFTGAGAGFMLKDLLVLGFTKALFTDGQERPWVDNVRGDCTNGLDIQTVTDISRVFQCHFWPYTTTHQSWTTDALLVRSGIAYNMQDVGDWNSISESFAYGYATGFRMNGVDNCSLINCGADYTGAAASTSVGFQINGTTKDLNLIDCHAAAQGYGVVVNSTTSNNAARIIGGNFWDNDIQHVSVQNGRTIVTGCGFRGGLIGVNIDAASDGATVTNCDFDTMTTAVNATTSTLTSTNSIVHSNRYTATTGTVNFHGTDTGGHYFRGTILSVTGDLALRAIGTNVIQFGNETNGISFRVSSSTAATVNYLEAVGAATGNRPSLNAGGTDANAGISFATKGTGDIRFVQNTGSTHFFGYNGVGTPVNQIGLNGGIAGNGVSIYAAGTDANIGISAVTKGTGRFQFGTHTGTVDVPISGFIEILDAGGTLRKLAVVT